MKLPCRHVLLINYLLCSFSFPGVFLNLVSIFEFLKKEKLFLEDLRSKGIIEIALRHGCFPVNLQSNFTEIALQHGCSPVNLLHISQHLFLKTPLGGCF